MDTLDNKTVAAIPGALQLSDRKFELYTGIKVNRFLWSHLWGLARHFPAIRKKAFLYVQTREMLQFGCLVPAVVLDPTQNLIAVFSNLTAIGDVPTPVVKITRERLDLIDPSVPIHVGARLGAASIYLRTNESMEYGQWSDLRAIVADCLVEDRRSCEAARSRLSPLAWQCLDIGLSQIQPPWNEGLFYVNLPHEMVNDAF